VYWKTVLPPLSLVTFRDEVAFIKSAEEGAQGFVSGVQYCLHHACCPKSTTHVKKSHSCKQEELLHWHWGGHALPVLMQQLHYGKLWEEFRISNIRGCMVALRPF
jgi:hypothetical protein